eukprot:TRINITY_DN13393_c0_g1_i1.p1 TRINITY_DN13393_c0_g1~~TRINITY_DN13393_c0_g1_i1.p1  ORF type:complete len:701 (-),score=193.97 TRINITY_DN13393_c0_g1_i1:55-2157(-)
MVTDAGHYYFAVCGSTMQMRFQTFQSSVEPLFWRELADRKLDQFMLSDAPVPITGLFSCNTQAGIPPSLIAPGSAFSSERQFNPNMFAVPGAVHNCNTLEDFKQRVAEKSSLLEECAKQIMADIRSGAVERDPALLQRFILLTFADLKKHTFVYWFAFPALQPPTPFIATTPADQFPLSSAFSEAQIHALQSGYKQLRVSAVEAGHAPPPMFAVLRSAVDGSVVVRSLADAMAARQQTTAADGTTADGTAQDEWMLGVADAGNLADNAGWTVRNALMYASVRWNVPQLRVICYREAAKTGISTSISMLVNLQTIASDAPLNPTGWEKNLRGAAGARVVDMSNLLDSNRLAESAVELNIKLMRWRLLPSLNIEMLRQTKCLLLGSGTLGCNVARLLMGWGVRRITMLDYGRVSYSNPVRQSLYTTADCADGGKPKARAAVEALKQIFPAVEAEAVNMSIPMPGHAPANEKDEMELRQNVSRLHQLIQEHDVVYLLTDSRESRWLPTVLCRLENKLTLNTALGFDTFVVMRHGNRDAEGHEPELGCYFCNDIVAPRDSLTDRTLDQQCTVTRPGLAMMASAIAVELTSALLHHPLRGAAAADTVSHKCNEDHALGLLPHQIRGFLTSFQNLLITGQRFDKCTACSPKIVAAYAERGVDFVMDVLRTPKLLEDISGVTEMTTDADERGDEMIVLSDDSEGDDM